jgi:hypothetical protein
MEKLEDILKALIPSGPGEFGSGGSPPGIAPYMPELNFSVNTAGPPDTGSDLLRSTFGYHDKGGVAPAFGGSIGLPNGFSLHGEFQNSPKGSGLLPNMGAVLKYRKEF